MAFRSVSPSWLLTRPTKISCPTRCVGLRPANSRAPQLSGVVEGEGEAGDAISEVVPQAVRASSAIRARMRAGTVIERPRRVPVTLSQEAKAGHPRAGSVHLRPRRHA